MLDMHVHLERGEYSKEWLQRFIDQAVKMGITELGLLEHSHRFFEFKDMYSSLKLDNDYGRYQTDWVNNRSELSINKYIDFIEDVRKSDYPIKLNFGLEICYFPGAKEKNIIEHIKNIYNWDFITGSIHWIDGWGFDHPKTKASWNNKDVDNVYERYFELMLDLIESNIFDIVAHPDSIKCFGYYPNIDIVPFYYKVAKALKKNDMKAEFNTGLHYRYLHKELGINPRFLKALKDEGVEIVTSSDAHCPEDVGKMIKKSYDIINNNRVLLT